MIHVGVINEIGPICNTKKTPLNYRLSGAFFNGIESIKRCCGERGNVVK